MIFSVVRHPADYDTTLSRITRFFRLSTTTEAAPWHVRPRLTTGKANPED